LHGRLWAKKGSAFFSGQKKEILFECTSILALLLPTMCADFRKIKHGIKTLATTRNANLWENGQKNWLGKRYQNSIFSVFRHGRPLQLFFDFAWAPMSRHRRSIYIKIGRKHDKRSRYD